MPISAYQKFEFDAQGFRRDVYVRGRKAEKGAAPAIVVMHEVPGLTPEVVGFADRLVNAGFAVYLPCLFGEPGKSFSGPYAIQQMISCCVRKEFSVLASNGTSEIVSFLRALARKAHMEAGGPGVGALGMCMTGNFALAMLLDDVLLAPVLCQPSLPFGITAQKQAAIHVSPTDLVQIQAHVQREKIGILGMRFTADPVCKAARFQTLREKFGEAFESIEIDSGRGNPHRIPRVAHSVLTKDLVDREGHPTQAALNRTIEFFRERLMVSGVNSRSELRNSG